MMWHKARFARSFLLGFHICSKHQLNNIIVATPQIHAPIVQLHHYLHANLFNAKFDNVDIIWATLRRMAQPARSPVLMHTRMRRSVHLGARAYPG